MTTTTQTNKREVIMNIPDLGDTNIKIYYPTKEDLTAFKSSIEKEKLGELILFFQQTGGNDENDWHTCLATLVNNELHVHVEYENNSSQSYIRKTMYKATDETYEGCQGASIFKEAFSLVLERELAQANAARLPRNKP